jgi:UTP--glucose-1-phosphate uridylyltransferase
MVVEKETVEVFHIIGKLHYFDSKLGYLKSNVEYAMLHKELGDELKEFLKQLV